MDLVRVRVRVRVRIGVRVRVGSGLGSGSGLGFGYEARVDRKDEGTRGLAAKTALQLAREDEL